VLLAEPLFEQNLRAVASLGLSFDLQLTPPYLPEAARLFGRIPHLPVALCHAGSPWARDANSLREWTDGLTALAALPAVVCKLSGLGMFDRDWTVESLTPIVRTVLDIFGPERVMWGSNFPVDKLYRSYGGALDAMLRIVPAAVHEPVFRGTAEQFYRI
jgi:predicted TIM-barrel fold metal-dependent hydrolase